MRIEKMRRAVAAGLTALLFVSLAALAPAVAQAASPDPATPQIGTDVFHGLRYVAYGHSFGQVMPGSGSTESTVYPSRVRDALGTDPTLWVNRTVRGSTTREILERAKSTWQRGDYGLVTFLGNQNDVGKHVPETAFKANVRGFIDWVRGPGPFAPTIVIVLDTPSTAAGYARYPNPPTDSDVARYNGYLRDVVADYPKDGSVVIADASDGWDKTTMISPDGQHPNPSGQAHIAEAIESAVANSARREGQNVGLTKPTLFYDSFNRSNNTAGLGATMYGGVYTTYGATTYGIRANRAYRADSGATHESAAVVSTGKSAVNLSLRMTSIASKGAGPVWRLSDANNYFTLDIHGAGRGNAKVYKRVMGTFHQVGSALSREVKPGSTVRVVQTGSRITVTVDGAIAYMASDAFNSTATRDGFRITEGGTARIDDLLIS